MYRYQPAKCRRAAGQAGFTLIETMIAVGIMAIVAAGISVLMTRGSQAARSHDTLENVAGEMDELGNRLKKYWLQRSYLGDVSAPGYVFTNAGGNPCMTNCPSVVITVRRPVPNADPGANGNGNIVFDTLTFTTACTDMNAGPASARVKALQYAALMQDNCIVCKPGQIPTVTITSQYFPADQRTFPHNGYPDQTTFRMSGNLGMSMCFNQSAKGPLEVDYRAFTLSANTSTDVLKTVQRSLEIPFYDASGTYLEGTN